MPEDKTEKKAMTLDEVSQLLNDPAVLQMAISKAHSSGMIKPPPPPKQEEDEDDDTPEDISLEAEEPTIKDVLAAINQGLKSNREYLEKRLSKYSTQAEEKIKATAQISERRKIQEFAEKHPHMKKAEVFRMMDMLYSNGMTIEDAYARATKAYDLKDEEGETPPTEKKTAKKEEPKKIPMTNISSTEEVPEGTKTVERPKSTKEAAKSALAEIMSSMPDADKLVNGEQT